jgi:hypothetical protein
VFGLTANYANPMRTLTITVKIQFPNHADDHVIDCIEKELPRVLSNDLAVLSRMAIHGDQRRGDVEVSVVGATNRPAFSVDQKP